MSTKRWKTILEALDDVSEQTDEAIEADASAEETPPESEDTSADTTDSTTDDVPPTEDSETPPAEDNDDLPDDDMPPEDTTSEEPPAGNEADYGMNTGDVANATVMQSLEQIYTPILIAQSFQTGETKDQIQEHVSNLGLLTESNMVKFDNETKLAQLKSVCALLLSREEKSEKLKAFVKSYQLTKKLKMEIMKEKESEATELARQYLQKLSSGSNEQAGQAATELLADLK